MFETTTLLREWLRESARHFKDTKAFSKKARDYRNGEQLDDFIKTVLANRGQPEQYENQIAKHNNSILGYKKEREIDIRLFGRQQADRATANMLNSIIKAITQVSDYESEVEALDDELSLEGVAIAELTITASGEFDEFGREHKDVEVTQVPEKEMFLDPFSRGKNYNKDARYISRCFWIDKEDLYGLGFDEKKIEECSNSNYLADILDNDLYADETIRKRVLLSYTWYRKYDKVAKEEKFYFVFWSGETILMQGESPFNFKGFPYEVEFLNRDFTAKIKYWGLYKDILPLQDHINYAKLRMQNMLANNKTLVEKNAIIDNDIEAFRDEFSPDDAIVLVENLNGIKDVRQNAQIQQILNIIVDNRNQIRDLLGTNDEMQGVANNRMSGVGQEQRIQTALVGHSHFMGSSDKLQKRIVKKMVKFIEQYYDSQRVVSIIDEDYMQSYITMNESVKNDYGSVDFEVLANGKVKPIANNTIAVGKYDLIFSAKPKSKSMSSERLRQNVELLKVLQSTNPELVQYLVPDILRDSDSPSALKIRQIIEQNEASAKDSPQAQAIQKLQEANQQLEMRLKGSQVNLNDAKAKSMIDKNKIDLQKAFSTSLIAKDANRAKHNKNQLDAMKGVR